MRRAGPGSPEPLGVDAATRRRQRRGLLGARDARSSSACSTRRAATETRAHRACPSAPATSSMASSPASRPARATGCARTARTTRATGIASTRRSCCVDPYARALDRAVRAASDAMLAPADGDATAATTADSAPFVPKAIVDAPPAAGAGRAAARAVGPTRSSTSCTCAASRRRIPACPRRCAAPAPALAHPAAIEHLTRLGVTTVELMPMRRAGSTSGISRGLGLTNYWGYNPVALFAPDPRLAPGGWAELRGCVAALQAAGIEVDPRRRAQPHRRRRRARADAVAARPRQRDLLPAARRRPSPLRRRHRLRQHAGARPAAGAAPGDGRAAPLGAGRGRRRLPLRPRDDARPARRRRLRSRGAAAAGDRAGPGAARAQADRRAVGHRARRLPPRRVSRRPGASGTTASATRVRRFWRGDARLRRRARDAPRRLGRRLRGRTRRAVALASTSSPRTTASRWPTSSRYARKHNEANGEGNRDGTDANHSWNHGVEGPTTDAADPRRRGGRDVRALLATLLLVARHADAGDGRRARATRSGGNNNAYAQDNALDVARLEQRGRRARRLRRARSSALRRAHPGAARRPLAHRRRPPTTAASPTSSGGAPMAAR